jgi:hypothetical protein
MYSLALELLPGGPLLTSHIRRAELYFTRNCDSSELTNLIFLDELQSDGDVIHQ